MKRKNRMRLFGAATVLCGIFSAVYEAFSHQVYSNFMIFAFLIPLLGGVVPNWILGFVYRRYQPSEAVQTLYHSGIAALTVGCLYAGILEIYGTTNRLLYVYPAVGGGLIVAAIAFWIVRSDHQKTALEKRA